MYSYTQYNIIIKLDSTSIQDTLGDQTSYFTRKSSVFKSVPALKYLDTLIVASFFIKK